MRTCSVEGCDRKHHSKGFCNFHYMKGWRGRNKQKVSDYFRKWSLENKEKRYSSNRRCFLKNKEKYDTANREWHRINKEKCDEIQRKYIRELSDPYIRRKFNLPKDAPTELIELGRSIINAHRIANER